MDNDALTLFGASLRQDLPTLDLHGTYPDAVREKLSLFLSRMLEKGETAGRVIYGGGTGKLGEAVRMYLQNSPLVAKIADEGGSCLLILN